MPAWKQQIDALKIPYPQKAALLHEIEAHLEHRPEEEREKIASEDLAELYEVHNTWLLKWIERAPPQLHEAVDTLFAGAPMAALLVYLGKENFMWNFIREGGAAMAPVLVIGLLLLLREPHLLWRVLLVKDHSQKCLPLDTPTVAIGAMGLVLLGICSTGLGAYFSASYVEHRELPVAVLVAGLRESLTCLVVSTSLASLVLLLHFFARRTLRRWKVPAALVG